MEREGGIKEINWRYVELELLFNSSPVFSHFEFLTKMHDILLLCYFFALFKSPAMLIKLFDTKQLLQSPFGRDHTVTSLFLYVARSVLSTFALLCRWAGVRGTIPQPIVVATVFALVVSSRRGQKILALLLSLLALRMVGEFIHGSVHGNEFWDDEYDSITHEWGKEDFRGEGAGSNRDRNK